MKRTRIVLALAGTVAAIALAVALAGPGRGIALYAYALALVAIAVQLLGARVRTALPATPRFDALLPPFREHRTGAPQLEELARRLSNGFPNAYDLQHRLRPLAREIAGARLARRHGVDLERQPERAHALVGPRTWELVRPERPPPADRFAPGWSELELAELVDELERI